MRTITQTLFQSSDNYISRNLASPGGSNPKFGKQESVIITTDVSSASLNARVHRVPKSELEAVWRHDPIIFNIVNKIVQTIMSSKHEVTYKNKETKIFYTKFFDELWQTGGDMTWEEILKKTFQHCIIFGEAHIENIFNRLGDKIVDWDHIDPKKMDYAKDTNGRVVLDHNNKSVGYTMTLPDDYAISEEKKGDVPKEIVLPANSFFIAPEKIAHIKLYTVGDGIYPVGFVEPIYRTTLRKLNMEEALANATYRHGFPTVVAELGDQNHEPTPQQIQKMILKLKDINFKQEIAVPYYYKLRILESKSADKLKDHLDYYKEQQIAGMGTPRPYATGSGEDENRAVLDNMSDLFQLTLRDIIDTVITAIRIQLFRPLSESNGLKEIPTIEWELIGADQWDRKSKRFVAYVKEGVMAPSENMLKIIAKNEGLD